MFAFTHPLKIYLFKDKKTVDLSLRVSDQYVQTYVIPQTTFEALVQNWRKPGGYSFNTEGSGWFVLYKTTAPQPEALPASYVRITVWNSGIAHNFRVQFQDMLNLEKEYFYQVHNPMYWD